MFDREVGHITRRRSFALESDRSSATNTTLYSDLVPNEDDLIFKFKALEIKISAWQCFVNHDPSITIDLIKTHHIELNENIHSLHVESILAHTSEKLSYDIIELVSVIDRIKEAGFRLIRGQEPVIENGGWN